MATTEQYLQTLVDSTNDIKNTLIEYGPSDYSYHKYLNDISTDIRAVIEYQKSIGLEGGKLFEKAVLWDGIQNFGTRTSYPYAFYGTTWTDDIYDPQYDITATANNGANSLFAHNSNITNTKVSISVSNTTNMMFYKCLNLVTIYKLIVTRDTLFPNNTFAECSALQNITIDGEIGSTISFKFSPLTVESMKNIIDHLVNYADTENAFVNTLTFMDSCWEALEADSAPRDDGYDYDGTWREYVTDLGWNI